MRPLQSSPSDERIRSRLIPGCAGFSWNWVTNWITRAWSLGWSRETLEKKSRANITVAMSAPQRFPNALLVLWRPFEDDDAIALAFERPADAAQCPLRRRSPGAPWRRHDGQNQRSCRPLVHLPGHPHLAQPPGLSP